MSLLASEVMDQSAAYLNDTALTLYTYATQLPYLKIANENLQTKLAIFGTSQQRKASAAIDVAALAVTLTLPSDFLLPTRLFERADGGTNADWVLMEEKMWNPELVVQGTELVYWAFYNNAINFVGATVAREVLLEYDRKLAIITSSASPEDFDLAKNYLSARTAELCARFIGQNQELADRIAAREVYIAEDELTRVLVLNEQGKGQRRPRYNSHRSS
jgi:hypothetical protein